MSDEPVICSHCGLEKLDACNGRGTVFTDRAALRTKHCPRIVARELAQHLGDEIARVDHVRDSPLLPLGEDSKPIVDHTASNLLIHGRWRALLPHFKWALSLKGVKFFFKVVTDQRLLDIYLGNEDYRSRPKSKRNDMVTFNGIHDVVGRDFHLIILRLGFLGYKNIAAPGVVKEALMLREALRLPTWVIIDPDRGGPTRRVMDSDVKTYLKRHYKGMKFESEEFEAQPDDEPDDIDIDELEGQVEVFEALDEIPEAPEEEEAHDLMNDPTLFGSSKKDKRGRRH